MTQHQPTRAERDLPAAQRANREIYAAKFLEHAAERRCIHCGAPAPSHLEEGESPPCGCP